MKILLQLIALLSLFAGTARADYISGTTRTIDYLTTNGDIRFQVNDGGVKKTPMKFIGADGNTEFEVGTLTNPSIVFLGDSNTGIYHPGGNQLGMAVDGQEAAYFASDGTATNSGIRVAAGSASKPSYAFIGNTGDGLYNSAAGATDVASGGVVAAQFSGSGLAVGTITAASSINWKVFTGSYPLGSPLSIPGSHIINATGWSHDTTIDTWDPIRSGNDNSGLGNYIYIDGISDTTVGLGKIGAHAFDYRIIVFYQ